MRFLKKTTSQVTKKEVMNLVHGAPNGIQVGGFARAKHISGEDFQMWFADHGGNWVGPDGIYTAEEVADYIMRNMPEPEYRKYIRQY